jgi:thioesterase domain-containing protein
MRQAARIDEGDLTAQFAEAAAEPLKFPCSLGQRRFWIADRLIENNTSLNLAVRWRLEGRISSEHMEQAFHMLIDRHETFRTRLVVEGGEPIQIVEPKASFRLSVVDLRGLQESDAVAEAERISRIEARTPFDLAVAPLLRAMLVRVREGDAMLLLTTHQAVCDGWGVGVLARELGAICDSLQTGKPLNLPELPLAYGEFALWQREWAESEDVNAAGESLKRGYQDCSNFELPSDFPRPEIQTMGADIRSRLLERELTDQFAATARRQGCTMFMAALAALFVVLRRYSGESDVNVGTQVAGRGEVELENLIGYFINTLIFRVDVSDDPSFEDLLDSTSDLVMEAFDNEHLPYEKLIEFVRPKPDLSRNTLFSVNFVIQRSFIKNENYEYFKLIDLPSVSTGAIYDMFFFMVERPDGWRLSCEFNSDLFKPETVDYLLADIVAVMHSANADPSRRISALASGHKAPERPAAGVGAVSAKAIAAPGASPVCADTEHRLKALWARTLGVDSVDRRADFFEMGGDPLSAIRLASRIEKEFGQPVEVAELFRRPAVADFAPLLSDAGSDGEEHFQVIELQEEGNRLPILVISMMWPGRYLELTNLLGPDQPFIGLQVFDLTAPEAFTAKTYEEVVARYVKLVRQVQPKGPYALFGWCAGGVLAQAVAEVLTREGETVEFVGVLDIWAPDYLRRLSRSRVKLILYSEKLSFTLQLIKEDWGKVKAGKKKFSRFLLDRIPGRVMRLFKTSKGDAPETRADVADRTAQLLDYLKGMANIFEPRPFSGKLTVMLSESEAKRWLLSPTRGWDRLAEGGVDLVTVPGDHFSVFQRPGVEVVAAQLNSAITECMTGVKANKNI